jgi:uncharacterized hydrophobic protein (TIGR00271 family)
MIVAATALAALGLRLDSAVVVIGAMLVAPLMSPIIAMALGISTGDGKLMHRSAVTAGKGVVVAVIVGLAVGLSTPLDGPTHEMLARAYPSLPDLIVALASGAAGAYALSRKSVSSSLPGVAIAVSLVPPLATTGIALSINEVDIAFGSFLLFSVNFVAVAIAGAVVFVWMGFKPEADRLGRSRTFGHGFAGLGVLLIAVMLPLTWLDWRSDDAAKVEAEVRAAIESSAELGTSGLQSLSIPRSPGGLRVEITLAGPEPLTAAASRQLQTEIATAVGEPVELVIEFAFTTHLKSVGPG